MSFDAFFARAFSCSAIGAQSRCLASVEPLPEFVVTLFADLGEKRLLQRFGQCGDCRIQGQPFYGLRVAHQFLSGVTKAGHQPELNNFWPSTGFIRERLMRTTDEVECQRIVSMIEEEEAK